MAERPFFPHQEVALPVPGDGPVFNLRRSLADADHAWDAAAAVLATLRAPERPTGAQTLGQLAAEPASSLNVNGLIDGLVGHPQRRILWKVLSELDRDLPRTQLLEEPGLYLLEQGGLGDQLALLRPLRSMVRPHLRYRRPIVPGQATVGAAPRAQLGPGPVLMAHVAAQLPQHGGRCPAEAASNLPD